MNKPAEPSGSRRGCRQLTGGLTVFIRIRAFSETSLIEKASVSADNRGMKCACLILLFFMTMSPRISKARSQPLPTQVATEVTHRPDDWLKSQPPQPTPTPLKLECGNYVARGRLQFGLNGKFVFLITLPNRGKTEFSVLGGNLEQKLRNALSDVAIEFTLPRTVDDETEAPVLHLKAFLDRKTLKPDELHQKTKAACLK